jgi:hypothetical protein
MGVRHQSQSQFISRIWLIHSKCLRTNRFPFSLGPYLGRIPTRGRYCLKSNLSSLARITPVTRCLLGFIDHVPGETYIAYRRFHVKDIHEVLRQKQSQQAQLGKQIEALQAAAEQIRGVAHLLNEEEGDRETAGID